MRGRLLLVGLLVAGTVAAVPSAPAQVDECAWPQYGHDPGHSFAQTEDCSDVELTTAPRLRPKWVFRTADAVTASPAVVGDTVYVGAWDGTFYALPADPPPGPVAPKWTFEINDANSVGFGRIVSSAAVVDVNGTRVVIFGGGATLYVLDAETGTELTSLCLDPRADPAVRCQGSDEDIEIESSPAVVPDRRGAVVVVGTDVHNAPDVGRTGVVALRLTARPWRFRPLWKFDPEAREAYRGRDLVTRGAGTGKGCGGVWSSPAVDADAGLVTFGTASCSDPPAAGEPASGGESVFTVRLRDGRLLWSHDASEPDVDYDDDFGASANLLPDGKVGIGSKEGWYYAFDRDGDGTPVWKTHAGQSGHLTDGFAVGGMIGSAATGLAGDEPAVFATTAISTPFGEPADVSPGDPDESLAEDPGRMLSLHAMSAVDGRVLWRTPLSRASYGSPSYADGVVLVPSTFDFSVKAFDAATGVPLWQGPLPGPPAATPVVVGDSLYLGVGTRNNDGTTDPVLSSLSGVVAFQLAG